MVRTCRFLRTLVWSAVTALTVAALAPTAAGAAPAGLYDVGVIPFAPYRCPNGSEYVSIYMDDEDTANASTLSGWTGAVTQRRTDHVNGTELGFCRVDGINFRHLGHVGLINWSGQPSSPQKASVEAYSYSVLKLGYACPPDSIEWGRSIENERNDNKNLPTGNIEPNTSGDNYTVLGFCLFLPSTQSVPMSEFPDIGVTYGVFSGGGHRSVPPAGPGHQNYWIATGIAHTDDEDGTDIDRNGNNFTEFTNVNIQNAQSSEAWGGGNTDFFIARVRDRSDLCAPPVLNYDGSFLPATYDGANCHIRDIPAGATGSVAGDKYYVNTAGTSQNCPAGTTLQGTKCFIRNKVPNSFISGNQIYLKRGLNTTCPIGRPDEQLCLVFTAPPGTTLSLSNGKFYSTRLPGCSFGGTYDNGRCRLMTAPAGRAAFIYGGAFYYGEK